MREKQRTIYTIHIVDEAFTDWAVDYCDKKNKYRVSILKEGKILNEIIFEGIKKED